MVSHHPQQTQQQMTSGSAPPSYNSSENVSHLHSNAATLRLPAGVKPSNFVRVSRPKPIVGVWVVDPSMKMAIDVFPSSINLDSTPDYSLDERPNIELECTAPNGSMFADIFVLPTPPPTSQSVSSSVRRVEESEWATIMLKTSGWMKLRLHDASPTTKHKDRLPIDAKAKSGGAMKLYLPRSFCGPLHLQAKKRVWYSSAIKAQLTPLLEVDQNHMVFVGSFEPNLWEGWQKWKGDSFSGDAGAASIDVYFDDEGDIPTSESSCVCI
ncbi:hypothetical protein CPB83DRAFT_897058 [Crepidotus variabilis]|uniref:DUF7330 domain-containing protein n=1 Tax=Crepidotus variabilis TaxID=179855 RepID=A0A9P6EAL5_9AGAR|nr:hypothetical protein CPB83DRAFT_897058 [Crepidotus variabilis]